MYSISSRDDAKTDLLSWISERTAFDVVELKETTIGQRFPATIDVARNGQWVPYGAGSTRIPPIEQRG